MDFYFLNTIIIAPIQLQKKAPTCHKLRRRSCPRWAVRSGSSPAAGREWLVRSHGDGTSTRVSNLDCFYGTGGNVGNNVFIPRVGWVPLKLMFLHTSPRDKTSQRTKGAISERDSTSTQICHSIELKNLLGSKNHMPRNCLVDLTPHPLLFQTINNQKLHPVGWLKNWFLTGEKSSRFGNVVPKLEVPFVPKPFWSL